MVGSFPSRISTTYYGRSLVADGDVPAGAVVAKFEGPVVPGFDCVPESEVLHAILIAEDQWLIPESSARFINHACEPNCTVNDDLEVVTLRPLREGEEFTIAYNVARPTEVLPPWDPRWSFECQCGAAECQKRVDGWVVRDD